MKRWQLINRLIQESNYMNYLEIGVRQGDCFDKVICKRKVGVDPVGDKATHKMISDKFFIQNDKLFDIIFIDGLHLAEQVYRDIINSLKVLNKGGTIVVHDINPPNEGAQRREKLQNCWTGDCWKTWIRLREERGNLNMKVFDIDVTGCGVIKKGEQEKLVRKEPLVYECFEKNRYQCLNLVKND